MKTYYTFNGNEHLPFPEGYITIEARDVSLANFFFRSLFPGKYSSCIACTDYCNEAIFEQYKLAQYDGKLLKEYIVSEQYTKLYDIIASYEADIRYIGLHCGISITEEEDRFDVIVDNKIWRGGISFNDAEFTIKTLIKGMSSAKRLFLDTPEGLIVAEKEVTPWGYSSMNLKLRIPEPADPSHDEYYLAAYSRQDELDNGVLYVHENTERNSPSVEYAFRGELFRKAAS